MAYRTLLCVTDGAKQHRLIRITEENGNKDPGISSGFFGAKLGNTHFTYHDNGLTHYVISPSAVKGKLIVNEVTKIPIDDIETCLQIYFQAIPAPLQEPNLLTAEGLSNRAYNKTLTLNFGDFSKGLNIDMSFVRVGKEDDYLDTIKNFFTKSHKLVGLEFIEMKGHADHRIALTLLATK